MLMSQNIAHLVSVWYRNTSILMTNNIAHLAMNWCRRVNDNPMTTCLSIGGYQEDNDVLMTTNIAHLALGRYGDDTGVLLSRVFSLSLTGDGVFSTSA